MLEEGDEDRPGVGIRIVRVPAAPSLKGTDVQVKFDGVYEMTRVAEAYAEFPGLVDRNGRRVTPSGSFDSDGPESDTCLDIRGETYHYLFFAEDLPRRRGERPLSSYYPFVTSPSEDVELKRSWRSPPKGEKRPDWFADVCGDRDPEADETRGTLKRSPTN